jgi:hypothetical protein
LRGSYVAAKSFSVPKGLLAEPSDGTLVAAKGWVARAPARTLRVLGRLLDAVAAMDYSFNVERMTPRDAGSSAIRA